MLMKSQSKTVSEIARVLELPRKTVYSIIKRKEAITT